MVLLVIDTQDLIMTDKLFEFDTLISNISLLIHEARKTNTEVIFIRHDDGPGEELTQGVPGFNIFDGFKPEPGEQIFDKTVNSPFKESGLLNYLKEKQETHIIVTGLQTDKCINATVISGFEHGFHMIVPAYANSTIDNPYMNAGQSYHYLNEYIWPRRYAECTSVEQVIQHYLYNAKPTDTCRKGESR